MKRIQHWQLPLLFLVAFGVFAVTAYPSITWWDSASYSLAAVTLGITPPPPGSGMKRETYLQRSIWLAALSPQGDDALQYQTEIRQEK